MLSYTNVSFEKVFVLHSPYPDQTWRGSEKCVGAPVPGSPMLVFSTYEDAEIYLSTLEEAHYFRVVELTLVVPSIGRIVSCAAGFGDPEPGSEVPVAPRAYQEDDDNDSW